MFKPDFYRRKLLKKQVKLVLFSKESAMYNMPTRVFCNFKTEEFPELKDRIFRIIWAAISYGHIRDQYFTDQVRTARDLIEKKSPKTLKQFLNIIFRAGLGQYFTKTLYRQRYFSWAIPRTNNLAWSRVWTLLKYGDIEIIEKITSDSRG